VFIGVGDHMCMSICICTVFLKKATVSCFSIVLAELFVFLVVANRITFELICDKISEMKEQYTLHFAISIILAIHTARILCCQMPYHSISVQVSNPSAYCSHQVVPNIISCQKCYIPSVFTWLFARKRNVVQQIKLNRPEGIGNSSNI
jgi:hypothetical protein